MITAAKKTASQLNRISFDKMVFCGTPGNGWLAVLHAGAPAVYDDTFRIDAFQCCAGPGQELVAI
jgi:hypothetical protein